jgi:RNA polymerase sigma-70 factor
VRHVGAAEASWEVFRARTRSRIDRPKETAALLAEKLEMAASAWPHFAYQPADLAAFLAEKLLPTEDALDGLIRLRTDDLFLVQRLLLGDARALDAFERTILVDVGAFVHHIVRERDAVAEVAQRVRVKLLTPAESDGERKLLRYSGRHPLRGWVCTVAVRTAIDLKRVRRHDPLPDDEECMATTHDPELALLRARHQATFASALAEACRTLDVQQRRVLRLFFGDGFTYRELGRVFHVDETTARRWVLKAKAELIAGVRALLATRLHVKADEIEPLFGLLQSRMDVSLARLLASDQRND